MFKILVIATLFVSIHTEPVERDYGVHHEVDYYTEPDYYFEYDVKDLHTGDVKSHKEQRKGGHTEGVYSLMEPGGSRRVVEYNVEGKKGGFVANLHRGPVKLEDKKGHVGVSYVNSNTFQDDVQEVQGVLYKDHGSGGSYDGSYNGDLGAFGDFHQLSHNNNGGSTGGLLSPYSYAQNEQDEYASSSRGSDGFDPGSHQQQFYQRNEGGGSSGGYEGLRFQPLYQRGRMQDVLDSSAGSRLPYSNQENKVEASGSFFEHYPHGYGGPRVKPSYSVREDNGESSDNSAGQQGNERGSGGSLGSASLNEYYRLSYGAGQGNDLGRYKNVGGSSVESIKGGNYLSFKNSQEGGSTSKTLEEAHSYGFGGHRLQSTFYGGDGNTGRPSYERAGYSNEFSYLGNEGVSESEGGYNLLPYTTGSEGSSAVSSHGGVDAYRFGGRQQQPYVGGHSGSRSGQGASLEGYRLESSHRGYKDDFSEESFNGYDLLSHNGNDASSSQEFLGNGYAQKFRDEYFQPSNLGSEGGQNLVSNNYDKSSGVNQLQYSHGKDGSTEGSLGSDLAVYQHGNEGSASVGSLGDGYPLASYNNYGQGRNAVSGTHSHGFRGYRLRPIYVLGDRGQSDLFNAYGTARNSGRSTYGHRGFGSGVPTSRVTYSTNGAKVYTSTKHLSPKN